jgi:Raf kinase inhibitor-like YbhB/YbcL family protein
LFSVARSEEDKTAMRMNRRDIISAATIGVSGIALGATDAFAQATPQAGAGATPVVGPTGRDPYAFLAGIPTFTVTSTDIAEGIEVDEQFRGPDAISPQLSWSGHPEGVQSYIVSCYDPDAPIPSGFWHWAVFNIPPDTTEIVQGAGAVDSTDLPEGSIQLPNDAGLAQYIGPAPPPGPPHRYFFAVLALDIPTLDLPADASPALMYGSALGHILGYGLLVPVATT